MARILIIYFANESRLRSSVRDHLYCFRDHPDHDAVYLNLAVRRPTRQLLDTPFDLIIFHTTLLSTRWNREAFRKLMDKAAPLADMPAPRAAIPQDEFIHTDLLCDFLQRFNVSHIFTATGSHDWANVYKPIDRDKTTFTTVLTGYLSDETIRTAASFALPIVSRPIDIGYRAWKAGPSLGRHGLLKTRIAEVFNQRAPAADLRVDISTEPHDTIFGDDWYRFLSRCRYTIGVEGGASILDVDGAIKTHVDAYIQQHPDATFEQVEQACFPGLDGSLGLYAISPRHLEACATRTGQILIEGAYNDVLQPQKHYIELNRDFSNLDAVLDSLRDDRALEQMTERAFEDIVRSGRYTYRSFVDLVVSTCLGAPLPRQPLPPEFTRVQEQDERSWKLVRARELAGSLKRTFTKRRS